MDMIVQGDAQQDVERAEGVCVCVCVYARAGACTCECACASVHGVGGG